MQVNSFECLLSQRIWDTRQNGLRHSPGKQDEAIRTFGPTHFVYWALPSGYFDPHPWNIYLQYNIYSIHIGMHPPHPVAVGIPVGSKDPQGFPDPQGQIMTPWILPKQM